MRSIGQNPTEDEILEIVMESDLNGDGTIDFKEFVDNSPIEALKSCDENQDANSCFLVERFNEEIGKNNTKIWDAFTENNYNNLIPLCSYGSDKVVLKDCNLFKKMSNGQCFTFNESSFDHRVGLTQGVNFVINYDYPATADKINNPATIILHDPNQQPDIKNIMAKNYPVERGHIIDLKFSATVIESKEDFDAPMTADVEGAICDVSWFFKCAKERMIVPCGNPDVSFFTKYILTNQNIKIIKARLYCMPNL